VHYDIDSLGPHEFERMAQALLIRAYGPTVTVFGTGKDDGRDATYDGSSTPDGPDAAPWNGYHVFQAKFNERPLNPRASKTWLLAQVRAELAAWSKVATRNGGHELQRKGRRPDYYVVITNVALSGQIDGGLDEVEQLIRDHAAEPKNQWPLKGCAVWDRSKVERLLTAYADVRQAFNGLLTMGDVLAALAGGTMTLPTLSLAESVSMLEEHARGELVHLDKVQLGEAGHLANDRIELAGVAIDLPAHDETDQDPTSSVRVLRHLIGIADRILRPSVAGPSAVGPHVLLMGGPGQGKTTLGRILVQTYRAALLNGRPAPRADVHHVIDATLARAAEIGLPNVAIRRWPFRVDLAEYATTVGPDTPLVKYIASKINAATGAEFTAKDTRDWLAAWPWLLVLDGYDEVAAAHSRDQVARAVTNLLQTAGTLDADLLLVVTC